MAKESRKRSAPTKKHLARQDRENRQMRIILITSLVALGLVIALVIYGIVDQFVITNLRPVAVVNGENIRAEDYESFARYNRYLLIRNAEQTYQFAQLFANDPNTQSQFKTQIMQIQQQLNPAVAGEQALNQLVDAALIRQEAQKLGIMISEDEAQIAMEEAFGFFEQGTPTPTATTEILPTSTLSSQQLTLIPPTATATITPTLTATATLTESVTVEPPTETPTEVPPTPTVDATPTQAPTPLPSATPTAYTREGFESLFADTIKNFDAEYGITENTIRFVVENQIYQQKMQDEIVGDLPCTQEQAWALHILVDDEALAQEILSKLDDGEDWGTLASTYSTDTSNKDNGGDLGWFGRGRMVPEFEEAAFSLEVGETSDPVQTSFGWHIIRLLGKEDRPLTNEECQQNRLQEFQTWLDGIRESSQIEIKDYWVEHAPEDPSLPDELIQFAQSSVVAPQEPPVLPEE